MEIYRASLRADGGRRLPLVRTSILLVAYMYRAENSKTVPRKSSRSQRYVGDIKRLELES